MMKIEIENYNGYSYNEAIRKLFKMAKTASTVAEEVEMRKIIDAIETYNK